MEILVIFLEKKMKIISQKISVSKKLFGLASSSLLRKQGKHQLI